VANLRAGEAELSLSEYNSIYNANAAFFVPPVPTNVVATAGNAQATVSWTAQGGAVSYTVKSYPGNFMATTTAKTVTITGLSGGTYYSFTVAANAPHTRSAESIPSSLVLPFSISTPPSSLIPMAGNQQVLLSWTAPPYCGLPILSYQATASPGGITATSATTSATITGLTNGISYTFTVVAINSLGPSSPSSPSIPVVPATVPGTPTSLTATAQSTRVYLSWTAPISSGGSPILSYLIQWGGGYTSATTTSATITGLTNGTSYTFTVAAINSVGFSPPSSITTTPFGLSDPPTSVVASPGSAQAEISWVDPPPCGLPILSYQATASPGGQTTTSASSPAIITGLTNGISYTFTVVATNSLGNSVPSSPSLPVVPASVPGAPVSLTANRVNEQTTLSWITPDDGGLPPLYYTITVSPGGIQQTTRLNTITITYLNDFTSYTFTVVATNSLGSSAPVSITPPLPTIVSGSIQFAPGSYLKSESSTAFSLNTSDFTMECFYYPTALSQAVMPIFTLLGVQEIGIYASLSDGRLGFVIPWPGNINVYSIRSYMALPLNLWSHIALVRKDLCISLYLNGTLAANYRFASPTDINQSGPGSLLVNTNKNNYSNLNGYLTNVRVVNGTAIYTSNFTVPHPNLPIVAGTVLMMYTTNDPYYLVDYSPSAHTITATGSPVPSSFVPA